MEYSNLEAVGYSANFTVIALVMLITSLEKSGALPAGWMKTAISAVLRNAGPEAKHLDYQFLGLEDSNGARPPLEVFNGGKQD